MIRGVIPCIAFLFLFLFSVTELTAEGMRGMKGRGPGFERGPHRGPHRGPGMGHGFGRGMCFGDRDRVREELNISDKQIDLICSINEKYHDKLIIFRDRIRPKKNALRKLLLRDRLDLKGIRKLLKEIADIEVEIRMIRIVQRNEIENVLTPAQRERMRRERRMHRGPGRHDR
jgi:Spy/CpxP family protein refolding chaperone